MDPHAKTPKAQACPNCFRPQTECWCELFAALPNHLPVLILQHPQETLKQMNSAQLIRLSLKNCKVKIGLSWPGLKKVSGDVEAMPSEWGVFYLAANAPQTKPVEILSPKKKPFEDFSKLKGLVLIDGSWKQAHALWWRNAWLLRLNRITIKPEKISLRGQAKESGLSSLEALAFALPHLGEKQNIADELLKRYRDHIVNPAKS